jgi:hypothetical protein
MAADTATTSPERSKTTCGADDVEREAKIPDDGGNEDENREVKRRKTINPWTKDDDDEDLEVDSPLCEPYIPKELSDRRAHPEIYAAFKPAYARYEEKQSNHIPRSLSLSSHPWIGAVFYWRALLCRSISL